MKENELQIEKLATHFCSQQHITFPLPDERKLQAEEKVSLPFIRNSPFGSTTRRNAITYGYNNFCVRHSFSFGTKYWHN
jgi:hypothetical protein